MNTNAEVLNDYDKEIQIANNFIKNVLNQDSYERVVQLYDIEDNAKYLFFDLKENGYVIVDIENDIIVEGGLEENKYIKETTEKYYYNGPLNYYQKEKDKFIDLKRNKKVDKKIEKVKFKNSLIDNTNANGLDNNENITTLAASYYTKKLTGTLPNYSYNPNGICGSTATAMFLMYYDNYINGEYVSSSLQTSIGVTLIKALVPYIDGSIPGSMPSELKSGLQVYIKDRLISHTIVCVSYSSSIFKSRIDANRPIIVDLNSDPTYGEHWVTANGYYMASSSIGYIIVNDGWGSTNVYINPGYIGYIVY